MADNDQLLKKIGNLIDQKLEPLKDGQAQTNTTLAQFKTTLETLEAGQKDIRENMATKADIQNLDAKLVKKIQDHAERIEELEKDADIPHPHKH